MYDRENNKTLPYHFSVLAQNEHVISKALYLFQYWKYNSYSLKSMSWRWNVPVRSKVKTFCQRMATAIFMKFSKMMNNICMQNLMKSWDRHYVITIELWVNCFDTNTPLELIRKTTWNKYGQLYRRRELKTLIPRLRSDPSGVNPFNTPLWIVLIFMVT